MSPYDLSLPGGVAKHILRLAERLRAAGDFVEVIGPVSARVPADGPHITGFAGVVTVPANQSHNRIGILTSPWSVGRYMLGRTFDIIHVHEPVVPALSCYAVWMSAKIAKVCTFHSYSEQEGSLTRLVRRLAGVHLQLFDRGIAVSEWAARYAKLSWKKSLAIVPNGVDTKLFAPRSSQPIRRGPTRLLFVGQWTSRRKGFPVLLAALTELRSRGIDAVLDVVGYCNRSNGRPAEVPGATFHGIVSETALRDYLHGCDIFVAPALGCESFGMVLLEAMAAGRPVVCTDIEGFRQLAASGGVIRVPPGDSRQLVDAIAGLVRDPERRHVMGERNLLFARRYDWDVVAAEVRKQYEAALEPSTRTTHAGRSDQNASGQRRSMVPRRDR